MKAEIFEFTRSEKTPAIIEKRITEFLKKVSLKKVIQFEHGSSGKLYYSLFYNESSEGDCGIKVLRAIGTKAISKAVNDNIKALDLMDVTQSGQISTNGVITTLFYKTKKTKKEDELVN